MVRIFDALQTESYQPGLRDRFPTAAGNRFVDRTEFIATEPHGIPPDRNLDRSAAGVGMGFRNLSVQDELLQSLPEGGS